VREIRMLRSMSGEEKRIVQTTPRFSSTLQRGRFWAVNPAVIEHFGGA
jgi:hypothetical protein